MDSSYSAHHEALGAAKSLEWVTSPIRLTSDDCDRIVELGLRFPAEKPEIVGGDTTQQIRLGYLHRFQRTGQTEWVFELLHRVAYDANRQRFLLSLSGMHPRPEYIEYVPGRGKFDWHNDYSHGNAYGPRKLTVICQLSDPDQYRGGTLEVFEREIVTLPAARGTIVVFPSFTYHRVTPVTQGIRRALVTWFGGSRLT